MKISGSGGGFDQLRDIKFLLEHPEEVDKLEERIKELDLRISAVGKIDDLDRLRQEAIADRELAASKKAESIELNSVIRNEREDILSNARIKAAEIISKAENDSIIIKEKVELELRNASQSSKAAEDLRVMAIEERNNLVKDRQSFEAERVEFEKEKHRLLKAVELAKAFSATVTEG